MLWPGRRTASTVPVSRMRYCRSLSHSPNQWSKNSKGKWTCQRCGRTGLLIRHRHKSWPPPVEIPAYGDRNGSRKEILAYAKVSPVDAYLKAWRWRITIKGYVYRQTWTTVAGKRKRTNLYMHRIILGLSPGDPLEGHHKDDSPTNNQRWNLERVTREQNERYKHVRRSD